MDCSRGSPRPWRLSISLASLLSEELRTFRACSGGGFGALLGLLLLIAIIIRFIWWILGAAALVGLSFLGRAIVRWYSKRSAEYARYWEGLAARADQQHNWVLQGGSTASKVPNSCTISIRRGIR